MALERIDLIGKGIALSPIMHGEPTGQEATGRGRNETPVRKISCVLPSGEIVRLPVVSGNGVRGTVRRRFIMDTMRYLEIENDMEPEFAYFLLAGGATGYGTTGFGTPEFREKVYNIFPFIDLLGGSLRGCFFPGKLRVDFMTPVTKETLETEVIKDYFELTQQDLPTATELISEVTRNRIGLTRHDRENLTEKMIERQIEEGEEKEGSTAKSARMVYHVETIPKNTVLSHGFSCDWAVKQTIFAFGAYVDTFLKHPFVGGRCSAGFGKVSFEYKNITEGEHQLTTLAENYWQYLEKNKKEIRDYLLVGLDKDIKSAQKKSKNG